MPRFRLLLLLFLPLVLWSCEKEVPTAATPDPAAIDRLIFGQFYGFCMGPACIENYLLEAGKLYVDGNDVYGKPFPYEGDWSERPAAEYAIAAPLIESFPAALWQADQETFGIPDAYDQGGYFLEARRADGTHRAWRLDTNPDALPEAIRPFTAQVREVLEVLEE
jgi:hypothetical protein